MKIFTGLCIVGLSALLCAGCASTDTARAPAPAPALTSATVLGESSRPDVNARYVAAVERLARQRGMNVIWINKPLKRASSAVAASD